MLTITEIENFIYTPRTDISSNGPKSWCRNYYKNRSEVAQNQCLLRTSGTTGKIFFFSAEVKMAVS